MVHIIGGGRNPGASEAAAAAGPAASEAEGMARAMLITITANDLDILDARRPLGRGPPETPKFNRGIGTNDLARTVRLFQRGKGWGVRCRESMLQFYR